MRRAAALAVLVALAGASPAGAQAEFNSGFGGVILSGGSDTRAVEQLLVPVTVSGQVSVAFHGPQTTGLVVWRPAPSGELFVARLHTPRRSAFIGILALNPLDGGAGPQTRAHVERTDAAGAVHTCSDVAAPDYAAASLESKGTHATFDLRRSGLVLVTTRCAGPLEREVTATLPRPALTFAQLRRGSHAIDLAAQRTFSAGGLAGTVSSSLVLHLGRPRHQGVSGQTPPRLRRVRRREISVDFAVERLTGTVPVDAAGSADPALCGPLDACGLAGTLTVAPAARHGEGFLSADVSARHSSGALRAAFGLSPGTPAAGVRPTGAVVLQGASGSLTAQLARDGGGCADTAPLPADSLDLTISGGRLHATYLSEGDDTGALRTRCPGPTLADVVAARPLAAGSVPVSALRAAEVTIHLTQGTTFDAGAWSGRSRPDLTLVLRRRRVTERVVREPRLP